MRRFCLLIFCFLLSSIAIGRVRINIKDQSSFNLLQNKIEDAINKGETDVVICLQPGKYYFKEKHLCIKEISIPNLSILVKGDRAILVPEGIDYRAGAEKKGGLSIYRGWIEGNKDISVWSDIKQTDQLIEIIDIKNKLCRIKSQTPLKNAEGKDQYILITQWYKSNVYKITKIEDNYIYFTASDLTLSAYKKSEYSINDDYNYLSRYPRYKLCNVSNDNNEQSIVVDNGKLKLPSGIDVVHECKSSTFLCIENCKIGQFIVEQIDFWGSAYGYPDSFITIKDTESRGINVGKCSFYGMHNNVIAILNTNNVTIENNLFKDIYYTGIQSDNKSKNTSVLNNSFYNAGIGISNTFCITCGGCDYYISGNKLENYGYGGIRVGLWYISPLYNTPCGIVEKNTLVFTNEYLDRIYTEGLMDGGAIYISTINDKSIVRYNYINGYGGAGGNRGIFCDDGALGYEIYGNVILNISRNDYCIASRREPAVEKRNDSRSELLRSNINNTIRDNILDGKIMFRGHEDTDNGCEKGANYVVLTAGKEPPVNQIDYIHQLKSDVIIKNIIIKDNTIMVPRTNYRAMKKSKEWHILRQYLKLM